MRFRSIQLLSGVLLFVLWGAGRAALQAGETPPDVPRPHWRDARLDGTDLADWIEALGSEVWAEREAAQQSLIAAGSAAIDALSQATSSTNLERAYRARHILDALDPVVGSFALVRVTATDGSPQIVSITRATGTANSQFIVSEEPLNEGAANTRRHEFIVEFSVDESSRVSVNVSERQRGYSSAQRLMPPLANAVSLVKITEESRYEQIGQHQSRLRQTVLTLMWTAHSRRSRLAAGSGLPSGLATDEFRDRLLGAIIGQAAGRNPLARRMALEILSYWRIPQARSLFAEAVQDPDLAAVAMLGLRQPEQLRELVRTPPAAEAFGIPVAARAAGMLIESGDTAGINVLFRHLLEGDAQYRHFYTASLTDAARHARGEAREAFVKTALSETCMARLDWRDPESHLLFHRAVTTLDAASETHRRVGEQALKLLDDLAGGQLGITSPNQRVYKFLWQSLYLHLHGADSSVRDGWLELLRRSTDTSVTLSVFRELEPYLSIAPLTDRQLELLLDKAVKAVETGRRPPATRRTSVRVRRTGATLQSVLRSLSGLRISAGQLAAVVQGLLRIGEAATSQEAGGSSLAERKLAAELIRWTGQPAERKPLQAALKSAEKWLKEGNVLEREKDIVARQVDSPLTHPMVLYEFDLRLSPGSDQPVGDQPVDSDHYVLLDGRRLRFTDSTWKRYTDRWGNRMLHAFEVERARLPNLPPRFRIHGSTTTLLPRVPTFLSAGQRVKSVRWYRTTNVSLGARYISRPSTPRLQTLLCLVASEDDPIPPDAESSPDRLWDWFLRTHILDPDLARAPVRRKGAVFHMIRSLRIKEGVGILRKLFAQAPYDPMAWQVARDLVTLGDRTALERYEQDLKSLETTQRVEAAVLLTECGVAAGVDDLLTLQGENERLLRRRLYRAFRALDQYLARPTVDLERKKRIVDYVLENLSSGVSQSAGFQIIREIAGDDFGFGSARGINNVRERRKEINLAIKAARDWWKREREQFGK